MANKKPDVILYTDGACSGNPGMGGWGSILIFNGIEKELSGYAAQTTNNRMELIAVIEGLKKLKVPCRVKVYSDSAYIVNAFLNGWLINWKKNDWKNSSKKEVSNKDLWMELDALLKIHEAEWYKVKGHSDDVYNNRCDALAVKAYKDVQNGKV